MEFLQQNNLRRVRNTIIPDPAPTNAVIPRLVSTLKRFSNKRCGTALWQRGYYEHVIRGEADYREVWEYIDENPAKWAEDDYYPPET